MNSRFIDRRHARLAALTIAALPFYVGLTHAQTSTAPAPSTSPSASSRPSAMTKSAPAPYRSAMDDYKPYTDEKVIDWKQANDNTARIGGWREYAKEAQQREAADASAKPTTDVKPAKP